MNHINVKLNQILYVQLGKLPRLSLILENILNERVTLILLRQVNPKSLCLIPTVFDLNGLCRTK